MRLDDELCLCFHVSKRKVLNYLRVEKPRRLSQLSDCQGAGTGCGWCRSSLAKLFEQFQRDQELETVDLPAAEEYARLRGCYLADGKGTPPS